MLGAATLVASSWLALGAELVAHPIFCFHLFEPEASCGGDATPLTIAAGVTLAAGVLVTAFGGVAFHAGRMKVALVPDAVRVTF